MTHLRPVLLLLALGLAARAQPVLIRAGRLVDPATGTATTGQQILVEGGFIRAVGPGVATPPGAQVVDLSDRTVLPGLIDAHTQLCLSTVTQGGKGLNELLQRLLASTVLETTARRALIGAMNARDMLDSGFTTVRDVGNAGNYADSELRRAIEEGMLPGPTILNAGRIITPLGGQFHGLHPERPDLGEPEYLYADTPEQMREAVRKNALFGANFIRIVVDDQPSLYSVEDVKALFAEAARAGLKVAAIARRARLGLDGRIHRLAAGQHPGRDHSDVLRRMPCLAVVHDPALGSRACGPSSSSRSALPSPWGRSACRWTRPRTCTPSRR